MFDWLKAIFGRKKKPKNGDQREYLKSQFRPGPDIVGRQAGQKRNRVHIYRQLYGYPIRLCDWIATDPEKIEVKGNIRGMNGPADDLRALAAALDYFESNEGVIVCKHCRRVVVGKRSSIGTMLMPPSPPRQGKGAP